MQIKEQKVMAYSGTWRQGRLCREELHIDPTVVRDPVRRAEEKNLTKEENW